MKNTSNVIIGFVSIFIGGLIYLLWRDPTLLMFSWFDTIGLNTELSEIRYSCKYFSTVMPNWFYYSLPNSLWLFGGVILFFTIWEDIPFQQFCWIFIFLFIAFGAEVGQKLGLVSGTFDINDILLMLFSCFVALLFLHQQVKRGVLK